MSSSASSDESPSIAAINPLGAFKYPQESIEYKEIHRQLDATEIVDQIVSALARDDSHARRSAELEVLQQVRRNPLELFRQLRSLRPVLSLPDLSLFLVTRDRDVRTILNNPTVFSVRDYGDRMEPVVGGYMLNRDSDPYFNVEEKPWMRTLLTPDDFPRIRRAALDRTAGLIEEHTESNGSLDVVSALARAVPVYIVQEYFGFGAPTERLLDWSFRTQDSFFHNVGYLRGLRGSLIRTFGVGGKEIQAAQLEAQRVHESAIEAGAEMRAYLDHYVSSQRDAILSKDTVLSRMLTVNDRLAHPKTMDRIRSNIMGGLIGAVETSNAAIVQSLDQLLKRPEVLAEARSAAGRLKNGDPIHTSAFAPYVWEALRFFPINPFVVRYVEQDTWIGDGDQARMLEKGRRVLVATHSAMQDPRSVYRPGHFDIDRPERDREMNLGYGMHRCLGDQVAKVMVPEVLRQLVLLPGLSHVPEQPPIEENQGIDFGRRGSFPERYVVRYQR